jgi:hypothetical protein
VLYEDEAEIARRRASYSEQLDRLAADTGQLKVPHAGMEACLPFFLAYQGLNDCELQRRFGTLVCRLTESRLAGPATTDDPIRIGIVSGHFFFHSVWKIPIKGWLSQLDRRRFRLFCYHTTGIEDAETGVARSLCERFVEGPLSLEAWREEILADRPHVIIYPEIGMDPRTAQLAALRLAPDILLNSISWSGFNTTMESLEHDLPIVTMTMPLMRGRHTLAILKLMGIGETIAGSLDEYVKIAVRLANDPAWRAAIKAEIAKRKHGLYCDRPAVTALDSFLEQAARSGQGLNVRASQQERSGMGIPDWLQQAVNDYFVKSLNVNPTTVLDIGANVGAFALRAHATARVISLKKCGCYVVPSQPLRCTFASRRRRYIHRGYVCDRRLQKVGSANRKNNSRPLCCCQCITSMRSGEDRH